MTSDAITVGAGHAAVVVRGDPEVFTDDVVRCLAGLEVTTDDRVVVADVALSLRDDRAVLTIDGNVVHETARDLAGPVLLWAVTRALGSADQHVAVHAAVVAWDGAAVVAVGAGGAGKTTLAAAAVLDGAGYLSDELALFPAGRGGDAPLVLPYPRPIGLRRGGADVLTAWRPAVADVLPEPDADGTHRLTAAALGGEVAGPSPCRGLVFLAPRTSPTPPARSSLSPAAAAAALVMHSPGDRRAALPVLAHVAANTPAQVLPPSDVRPTVAATRAVLTDDRPGAEVTALWGPRSAPESAVVRIGDEAVAVTEDGQVHHLNAPAAAVLTVWLDGGHVAAAPDGRATLEQLRRLTIVR